jgi:hypothetical protein
MSNQLRYAVVDTEALLYTRLVRNALASLLCNVGPGFAIFFAAKTIGVEQNRNN